MQHALVEDVVWDEGQLMPEIQKRSHHEDHESQDALRPENNGNRGRHEYPPLPRLCPESERQLVRQRRNGPDQGKRRERAKGSYGGFFRLRHS